MIKGGLVLVSSLVNRDGSPE